MKDVTLVYCTSNKEDPGFEERTRQTLIEAIGDMPVISVSQKPIDFGTNICVGDIGASMENYWKQIRLGTEAAQTKFVSTAEVDSLYHKSYYDFQPTKEDVVYTPDFLYILWVKHPLYCYPKSRPFTGGIAAKAFMLEIVEDIEFAKKERFSPAVPVVSFKTDKGMHLRSPVSKKNRVKELPYWGKAKDLVKKYVRPERNHTG